MSDREDGSGRSSPGAGSYQEKSPTASEQERAPSSTGSLRESRSRSKSRSKEARGHSPPPKRARSRTRSRSPMVRRSRSHSRERRRYSRSRSRSPRRRSSRGSPRRRRDRSHSHSPMSNRRRHQGNREAPEVTSCVGVFGLSLYTTERDLREYFGRFGPMDQVEVVHDHQTGRSRGFGFIYYKNKADAREAKESAPGSEIDGRKIRVDYSITQRAHTPTPGIYLGKPTTSNRRRDFRDDRRGGGGGGGGDDRRGGGGGGGGYRDRGYSRRSPSPYYRERRRGYSRSRSRSRSYSPRKYSSSRYEGRYGPSYY